MPSGFYNGPKNKDGPHKNGEAALIAFSEYALYRSNTRGEGGRKGCSRGERVWEVGGRGGL